MSRLIPIKRRIFDRTWVINYLYTLIINKLQARVVNYKINALLQLWYLWVLSSVFSANVFNSSFPVLNQRFANKIILLSKSKLNWKYSCLTKVFICGSRYILRMVLPTGIPDFCHSFVIDGDDYNILYCNINDAKDVQFWKYVTSLCIFCQAQIYTTKQSATPWQHLSSSSPDKKTSFAWVLRPLENKTLERLFQLWIPWEIWPKTCD